MTAAVPRVNRDAIQVKTNVLVDARLWPSAPDLNVPAWLSNFDEADLDFAYALLNAFLYIPNRWVDELFIAGLRDLSRVICTASDPFVQQQREWRRFLQTAIITYMTGEEPNPTDSGYAFARRARQLAGLPEINIMHPNRAFEEAKNTDRAVIFVDDFVGSGSQTQRTWTRAYGAGSVKTFSDLAGTRARPRASTGLYYVPLFMTESGRDYVQATCPGLTCRPVHVLDGSFSALSPNSKVWPPGMQQQGVDFVKRVSLARGVPETGGSHVDDWRGFAALGLCFAFEHSIPDATMPIFRWEEDGWKPLKRRV